MPQDSGDGPAEPREQRARRDWKVWITAPGHLVGTTTAVAALGFVLGYLVMAVAVLPSDDVSDGLTRVPDLLGLPAEEARDRVDRAGFQYEETAGLNHAYPVGTVVAQEPLADLMARPGGPVKVTLSLGPRTSPVPNVLGLGRSQAEIVLRRSGYESEFIWVDADASVGEVVGTRPQPGTLLELPASVRLIVSAGPRTVNVPDLSAVSLEEASDALERLGLKLGDVVERADSLAAPGTVLDQSPQPGSVVDRGGAVSVVVAVTPPPFEPGDTTQLPPDTTGALADTTTENGNVNER